MPFLESFGINEENIRSYYNEWKIEFSESINDFLWHIFNTLLNENASQSNDIINFYKRNERIYIEMISFCRRIEKRPANELHKVYNENRLKLTYETSTLELDVKILSPRGCSFPNEINERVIPFKEALKNDIIPYEKCERKQGCACSFSFLPKRDTNGRLLKKNK